VRLVPNNEQKHTKLRKTYSQVVSNDASEAKHTTSVEHMLVQILQMLKDQNLRFNKIESNIKI
jgi:hypothetical protein